MSGLFGAGATQSTTPTRYNGIQISSSASGGCVPVLYGRARLPFNLGWYGAFTSTPVNTSSGGKGGGSSNPSSFDYKASFVGCICEGPITGVFQVWNDKDQTTLAKLGMTLFLGAGGQASWAYLTTSFAGQDIPYDHIAYVGAQNYDLGSSAALPNITFEVGGFLGLVGSALTFTAALAAGATQATTSTSTLSNGTWNITFSDYEVRTAVVNGTSVKWGTPLNSAVTISALGGGVYDADPAAIVTDYLTDGNHGVGFSAASVAVLTGANGYSAYCQAMGITLSPCETTQRAPSDFLKEIFQITNSDAVWSAGLLKVLPYADAPVAGNGFTFTPDLTPVFIFTDDDFEDIPELDRIATADTFNHVRVEYLDRSNSYNTAVAEATDLGDIALTGERVMSTLNFHEITNSATARIVAQLALQTSLYERNTIKIKVRPDYSLLEPMDYIGICDPLRPDGTGLGYGTLSAVGGVLTSQVFRVTRVTDDANDMLEIEAMECPGTIRSAALYNWAGVQGYNANFGADPGNVQAPAFVEVYGTLVSATGGRTLYIAVTGSPNNAEWGGCDAFMSFDGTTYEPIGNFTSPARYGATTTLLAAVADPDTTSTTGVALNNVLATLNSGTQADADADRILMAIGTGALTEIISYQNAALTATPGTYNLSYMRRGQYSTNIQAHAIGSQFVRLDGNVLGMDIDPGWLGQTLYFKFCSWNRVGRATQSLAVAVAYTFVPGQSAIAYKSVVNSTFAVSKDCVLYSPTTGFKKTTGATAWDSTIYSTEGFYNGCTLEFQPSAAGNNNAFMGGLCANPLTVAATLVNNYLLLSFAWYCANTSDANGQLQIYEGGVYRGNFGTYAAGDLFQIIYDGTLVNYWHNNLLVRSVAITNGTFFGALCFVNPGTSVFGLDFDSSGITAVPITFYPLSVATACTRATAVSNNVGVNGAWDNKTWQSLQSFQNGCVISFAQLSPATSNGYCVVGLSTGPFNVAVSGPGSIMMAGWYLANPANIVHIVFNGTDLGPLGSNTTNATPADVFSITYDGFYVTWFRNGVLQYQVATTSLAALYAFGNFYNTNSKIDNLSFESYNETEWAANGTCVVDSPTSCHRTAGAVTTWDASVYSLQGLQAGTVGFYPGTGQATYTVNSGTMVGLSGNPTASPSYTNLLFSLYLTNTGIYAYEQNGTVAYLLSPNFAVSDFYAIGYDGKHITYYKNGVSMRSIIAPNLILYAQVCFAWPGAVINGLDWSPNPHGAVPFTLLAITTAVVASGNTVYGNALNTAAGYGLRPFASKDAIQGGAVMSASINPQAGAMFIGFSNTVPTPSTGYGLAIWYPHNDVGQSHIVFNGATMYNDPVPPLTTDVFTITYDNFNFRWYKNNILMFTVLFVNTNAGSLYLYGDMFEPGLSFVNISFGPFASAQPAQFIGRGGCVVNDENVTQQSGPNSWTVNDAYSIVGYVACHIVFKPGQLNGDLMVGLVVSNPANLTPNYTNISFAWNCNGQGNVYIYESGTLILSLGTYALTDFFAVTYDGSTITYWRNSVAFRTVSLGNQTMYGNVVEYEVGIGVNSLDFGPGAVIPLSDTGQIGTNAVSTINAANNAALVTVTGNVAHTGVQASLTLVMTISVACTGAPVEIDTSVSVALTVAGSSVVSPQMWIARDSSVAAGGGGQVASGNWDPTANGSISITASSNSLAGQQVTLTCTDNPVAGVHSYGLFAQLPFTGAGGCSLGISNKFIKVREIKK